MQQNPGGTADGDRRRLGLIAGHENLPPQEQQIVLLPQGASNRG
jgi:hypothetical protein